MSVVDTSIAAAAAAADDDVIDYNKEFEFVAATWPAAADGRVTGCERSGTRR